MMHRSVVLIACIAVLATALIAVLPRWKAGAASPHPPLRPGPGSPLDGIAERYVKLALALGQRDPLYVDAYYGPSEWRGDAKREKKPFVKIKGEAARLLAEARALDAPRDEDLRLRRQFLIKQIESVMARAAMLGGTKYMFRDECRSLYDAEAPPYDEARFKETIRQIDALVPRGTGSLAERLERYKKGFVIPRDKLDAVFTAAISEARARTKRHIPLPADESFSVEYVSGKSWGAYNWYQGNNRSVIQINTDLPNYIDSPLGLACHEGYPGHHVQNVLIEQNLAKGRGWVEYTVYPLFSPQSLIAEGIANFGIEVAFPKGERVAFERDVLFPLAGLDPAKAKNYYAIQELVRTLQPAQNEAARRYLDGERSAYQTTSWLAAHLLVSMERARKLVSFMDRYRAYIINYTVGYDLVKSYIDRAGGTPDHPEKRWEEFAKLLASDEVPSGLK